MMPSKNSGEDEMDLKDILYEKQDGIAVATFNRPECLNAFRNATLHEFQRVLEDVKTDDAVRALVLSGQGRAFSSGRDLKHLTALYKGKGARAALRKEVDLLAQLTRQLVEMPKVIIAALNGVAVGIGIEFALACDIRIASENASFGFPEVKRSLFVTNGVLYFLPRLVGLGRAKAWLLTGERVLAQEALESGLVTRVVDAHQLHDAAFELAQTIAANAPLSVRLTKSAFWKVNELDLDAVMRLEADSVLACHASEDFVEGARAFVEKRDPAYKGK